MGAGPPLPSLVTEHVHSQLFLCVSRSSYVQGWGAGERPETEWSVLTMTRVDEGARGKYVLA